MASIMVGIRQKVAAVFASLAEAHAAEVAAAVEPRLRALLKPGEVLPDFTLVLLLLGRLVAAAAHRLVARDRAHENELVGDIEPRVARDQAAHTVRRKLVEIRKLAAAVFGRQRGDKPAAGHCCQATLDAPESNAVPQARVRLHFSHLHRLSYTAQDQIWT